MATKSDAPMFCRWCGRPLRKHGHTVEVMREKTEYHKDSPWCRYIYPAEMPRTAKDCQKLTNKKVISVRREYALNRETDKREPTGFIDRFTEWDGESYDATMGFFCTNGCAMSMGRAAAKQGLVGPEYRQRMKIKEAS